MPQVMMPKPPGKTKPPEKIKPSEVSRQPDLPRQPEPPKQPEGRKAPGNGFLSRCRKHWKGMSIFSRIMFVMGVYGTAVCGIGIVLGLMAERGATGNAGPVWFSLAAFLLNVRNLFWLFHCEGVGYYGIYADALSLKPDWVARLAATLLGLCYIMIYSIIAVASFVVWESVNYYTDDNILTAIVAVGMLAFWAFNFIWPVWRCRTCDEIYWKPKKRKK